MPVRQVLVGDLEPATLVILSAPSATPAFLPVLVLLLAVLEVLLPLGLSLSLSPLLWCLLLLLVGLPVWAPLRQQVVLVPGVLDQCGTHLGVYLPPRLNI